MGLVRSWLSGMCPYAQDSRGLLSRHTLVCVIQRPAWHGLRHDVWLISPAGDGACVWRWSGILAARRPQIIARNDGARNCLRLAGAFATLSTAPSTREGFPNGKVVGFLNYGCPSSATWRHFPALAGVAAVLLLFRGNRSAKGLEYNGKTFGDDANATDTTGRKRIEPSHTRSRRACRQRFGRCTPKMLWHISWPSGG